MPEDRVSESRATTADSGQSRTTSSVNALAGTTAEGLAMDSGRSMQRWRRVGAPMRRMRGRMRRSRTFDTTWRAGVFIVGVTFVLAGLVMFVTPGPGWLTVILGLAILATEFAWAHRVLNWAKRRAREASARALDPSVRRRNLVLAAVVVLALAAASWWWVARFGWPPPVTAVMEWVRS